MAPEGMRQPLRQGLGGRRARHPQLGQLGRGLVSPDTIQGHAQGRAQGLGLEAGGHHPVLVETQDTPHIRQDQVRPREGQAGRARPGQGPRQAQPLLGVIMAEGNIHVQIDSHQTLGGEEIRNAAQGGPQRRRLGKGQGLIKIAARGTPHRDTLGIRQIQNFRLGLDERKAQDLAAGGGDAHVLVVKMDQALQPLQGRPVGVEIQRHLLDPEQDMAIALILAEGEIGGPAPEDDLPPGHPAGGEGPLQPGARAWLEPGVRQIVADDIGLGVADIGLEIQDRPPGGGCPQILEGKTQLQAQVRVEGIQAVAGQSQRAIGGGHPGHGADQAIQPERWPVAKDSWQAQVQALPGDLEPPARQVRRQVQIKPRRLEPHGTLAGNLTLERQALQAQPRLAPPPGASPGPDNGPPGRAAPRPPGGPGAGAPPLAAPGRRRRPG
jgi:hypothetical protein